MLFAAGRRAARRMSYADLDRDTDRIAHGLAHLGVTRGTRTVLFVRPGPDLFPLVFALFKAGAVPVMIDPGMGPAAVGACIAEAEPEAFVGVSKAHVARVALRWGKASITTKVVAGSRVTPFGTTLDQVRRRGADEGAFAAVEPRDGELAAVLFTSGSTGPAKGVEYTHAHFLAQVRLLRDAFDIAPGEVDLPTFPLFALFDPALGMTTVVPEMDFAKPGGVDPLNLLRPIREHAVTHWFGSPAVLRRVAECADDQEPLPSLRRVLSAGAPVPAGVLERIAARLTGGAQVFTPYGATEALPVAVIGSDEVLAETAAATRDGHGICVGRVVPETEVRVIGITDDPLATWDDATALPVGTVGEFVVRGPSVTTRYFRRDDATRLAKIADHGTTWHRMGDVGARDAQGRLWFHGRKSQRVTTRRGVLFPDACEAVFAGVEGVRRSALVGVPCSGGLETPVLAVELGADAAWPRVEIDVRRCAREHEGTSAIETFLHHPGPLPVDPRHNAKIRRESVREWAVSQLRGGVA